MKYFILLALFIGLFVSCQNQEGKNDSNDITVSTKNLDLETKNIEIETPNDIQLVGEFIEKFPNGNVKTEGWNNKDGFRDGIWYSYYENGIKWGETSYKKGLKDGHSIVFYPNGKVRYMGDYSNDKKIGHWLFYLESGEIDVEEDY
jgi:antitoxin component YwqK of YwqJK toxin-antitoxin module